jgi:hypothetical protein
MNMAFTRRNVWTLLSRDPWDNVTEDYARAVATMKTRPAADPTSWAFQAAIHGSYAISPNAAWNACQHASWFFLPWHRMYLYFFERIVRAAVIQNNGDADWALPYWNYDQPPPHNTLPLPMREPMLSDKSTANPLYLAPPRRNAQVMNGAQLPKSMTSPRDAMLELAFVPGFGGGVTAPIVFGSDPGALELTPHNVLHVAIGGQASGAPCQASMMSDPSCAALDPVFWMHHCNIDRLWTRWLAQGAGRKNPVEGEWLTQSFTFYDENGAKQTLTCADVLDTSTQLDYVYEDDSVTPIPDGVTAGATMPTPSGEPTEMVAASEHPVELKGGRTSVALSVAPGARARIGGSLGTAVSDAPPKPLYLRVEDIDAPRNPGVVYGVYLNAPAGGSPEERERHRVGNVTLFGIEAIRDPNRPHTVPGLKHTFNITRVVSRLRAAKRWDPDDINVTFEPISPVGAASDSGAVADSGPGVAVKIGRVSLFV